MCVYDRLVNFFQRLPGTINKLIMNKLGITTPTGQIENEVETELSEVARVIAKAGALGQPDSITQLRSVPCLWRAKHWTCVDHVSQFSPQRMW